jgi:hypothetical protein
MIPCPWVALKALVTPVATGITGPAFPASLTDLTSFTDLTSTVTSPAP